MDPDRILAVRKLFPEARVEGDAVFGTFQGVPAVVRFTSRGSVSSTQVDAYVGKRQLLLEVRPRTARERPHRGGRQATHLAVGHPEFDGAFSVVGAPQDVVVRLFDLAMCDALLELRPKGVRTVTEGDALQVRVEDNGYLAPAEIGQRLALMVRLAGSIQRAFDETGEMPASTGRQVAPSSRLAPDAPQRPAGLRWPLVFVVALAVLLVGVAALLLLRT